MALSDRWSHDRRIGRAAGALVRSYWARSELVAFRGPAAMTIPRCVTRANTRRAGVVWALVCCPLIAWAAALYGDRATHGKLGVWSGALLLLFPATLAGGVSAALGGGRKFVWGTAISAVAVTVAGVVAFAVVFFLTVPDGFFN